LWDAPALTAIRQSFADSDETYGARRVWLDLRAWQIDCGRGQIERLMRRHELVAKPVKRQLPLDSGTRPEHGIAPNELDRQFDAASPNQR
jgi:putative transposase